MVVHKRQIRSKRISVNGYLNFVFFIVCLYKFPTTFVIRRKHQFKFINRFTILTTKHFFSSPRPLRHLLFLASLQALEGRVSTCRLKGVGGEGLILHLRPIQNSFIQLHFSFIQIFIPQSPTNTPQR